MKKQIKRKRRVYLKVEFKVEGRGTAPPAGLRVETETVWKNYKESTGLDECLFFVTDVVYYFHFPLLVLAFLTTPREV